MNNLYALISCLTCLLIATPSLAETANTQTPKWQYSGPTGPQRWAQLSNSYAQCKKGQQQSPINLTNATHSSAQTLYFGYQSAPMDLTNNGHTVKITFPKKCSNEEVTYDNKLYQLEQFHFHMPSEHLVNNKHFPAEIHFVHKDDQGHYLVIASLLQLGKRNPLLERIIQHMPQINQPVQQIVDNPINPRNLLAMKKHYYEYTGSFTTPPCTEGVKWIIFDEPITLAPEQLQQLEEHLGVKNARPVQALNDRKVIMHQVS